MALRITKDLVKFDSLMHDLGLSFYEALGLLEALWHFTAKNAMRGDVGRHTNEEIARWIGWKGDANKMIESLTNRRWLDRNNVYRLVVHDWHVHADKSVRATMRNRKLIFVQDEEVTNIPEKITGVPDIWNGAPPEYGSGSGAEGGEQGQGAESGAEDLAPIAAELANEFHLRIPGMSRPTLPELSAHFQAKLHWLRANGRDEAERIKQHIIDPKRDKGKVNTINKMFLFWNDCGIDERTKNGKRTEGTGGRYEGLEAPSC